MRRRKARRAPFTVKQALCSIGALAAAFLVMVLLNDALGGGLPLPGAHEVESHVVETVNDLYAAAKLTPPPVEMTEAVDGDLLVHYVDVGQADCELIQTPEQTVLIDAGEIGGVGHVVEYLKAQGITRIDLLIATHPHADHIGGMADVVEAFDIGKIIFTDPPKSLAPTSKTYENLLDTISAQKYKITKARPGAKYELGSGIKLTILGPLGDQHKDLNDTSVVCRLDYDETSFLFTGDAEKPSEDALIEMYGSGLKADVLKLGHHGSSTSTQQKWLNIVEPDIAVCCVGTDNSYGHPHAETVKRLTTAGVRLYRTDKDGTVVITSDGKNMSVTTEKS